MKRLLKHFEHHRIGMRTDRAGAGEPLHRRSTKWFFAVSSACQPCSTTTVWCGLDDDGGPFTLWPGASASRVIDHRAPPFAGREKKRVRRAERAAWSFGLARSLREGRAAADRLDRDRSTTSSLLRSMKPKRPYRALEGGFIALQRRQLTFPFSGGKDGAGIRRSAAVSVRRKRLCARTGA